MLLPCFCLDCLPQTTPLQALCSLCLIWFPENPIEQRGKLRLGEANLFTGFLLISSGIETETRSLCSTHLCGALDRPTPSQTENVIIACLPTTWASPEGETAQWRETDRNLDHGCYCFPYWPPDQVQAARPPGPLGAVALMLIFPRELQQPGGRDGLGRMGSLDRGWCTPVRGLRK